MELLEAGHKFKECQKNLYQTTKENLEIPIL